MKWLEESLQSIQRVWVRGVPILILGLIFILIPASAAFSAVEGVAMPNPGTDLWRAVRQREGSVEGVSQIQGIDRGVLVNPHGEDWREYRMEWLTPISIGLFLFMIGALTLYFLIRGRIQVPGGASGHRILRSKPVERLIHWFNAAVFLPLAVTGLLMLYGRWLLIPLIGQEDFARVAEVGKLIHNYLGPLFIVSLALLFFVFVKESFFLPRIWERWVLRLGGYFGGREPVSGKFNPGQKAWFWTLSLFGVLLCLTGLALDFPVLGLGRVVMELIHLVHTVSATILIAFLFVHIYLGGIGIEGVFQTMVHGYVDAHWARHHHYCWYKEMEREKKIETAADGN